ncbi:MAG: S-adenosylmethionine decarboxylase [Candidatus Methanomethylophilaceae archaeon]|nr:S-adenosylmethionine decarboxylase [Candidatus Methanomethylophilaceae archaeon]
MSSCAGPLLNDEESIAKYNNEKHWGLHIAIDLAGCDHAKICDGDYIKQFAIDLAEHIHMKRYGEPIAVRFGAEPKVEGYSLIQLIETSCISGHFAEDTDRAFIDVFSCKDYPPESTANYCKEYFGAQRMQYATLFRDIQ